MSSVYPGAKDTFTNPIGTQTLDSPDHAAQHGNANDAILAIQTTLGTNAGTSVLKNYTAGDLVPKTNNQTFGSAFLQSPAIAGGTMSSTIINNGTVSGGLYGTATYQGGTANNLTLGTPIVTGGVSLSVNGNITQTSTADHITLTPGANKLVKSAVLRQDSNSGGTANTFQNNQVILTGWYFITGNGTLTQLNKTVVFGTPGTGFTNVPIPTFTGLGYKDGSDPTSISDFSGPYGEPNYLPQIGTLTIGSMVASHFFVGAATNGRRFGYAWHAIGSI